MTTLIIMGHGRVAADETMTVPDGCTLNFYAPQGYAISKGYAGKVMTDALPPSERYVSGAILSKHYLCPSLDIEITARFRKAAHYRDKTDAWVIQLKNHPALSPACRDQGLGDCVELTALVDWFRIEQSIDTDLNIHWNLCRNLAGEPGIGTVTGRSEDGTLELREAKGALNAPIVPLTHPIRDLIVLKPVSAHLADLDFSTHY